LTPYARPDDIGKAAKDWPQLNFLVFHSAYRYVGDGEPAVAADQFERTGRLDWVTEVAEIRDRYGVSNVYSEIGACFAIVCITHPRIAAAMLGTLIKGLGTDHLLWGTDSIWFGSPQWQIEALRRLEIPEDMRKKHGFAALGDADGPVKSAIFGHNSARLFNLEGLYTRWERDRLNQYKQRYAATGGERSNQVYGYIRKHIDSSSEPGNVG